MKVPFFPYKDIFIEYKKSFHEKLDQILDGGQYIFGDELKKFENSINKYVGSKYCLGVANATDALEMMLEFNNFQVEDEIILPSHTMVATLSAIVRSSAIPVPVDINMDGTISIESIKKNINQNTKAIIVAQLNGHTCDMDEINEVCENNNLLLFEDSAQALGSKHNNKFAGTFGLAGCFSFYPAKILGGPGDGGALITNNEEFYDWALKHRDHGRGEDNQIHHIGRNSRLDNLMAAFLNAQFIYFDNVINRRREVAKIYNDSLAKINQINLPLYEEKNINIKHFDTFQNYEILADKRDELKKYLSENGVGTLIQWGGITTNQILNFSANSKSSFSNTKSYYERCLMLPMNTIISDDQIHHVINIIKKFYEIK